MKHLNSIAAALIISSFALCSCRQPQDASLESAFANPPAEQRVGCYWYWINRSAPKEGVIADLHAMKKAGITRAYIGLTGGGDDLEFMSDEWWDLIHTTLKTAGELDIEIGTFNSPGWSQSGGPWNKPSQTMRYLAAIERRAKGPAKFAEKIPVTENDIQRVDNFWWGHEAYQGKPEDFQDVRVLAFPVNTELEKNLFNAAGAKITTSSNITIS
ncbi:MAG: hypothetical protein LBG92_03920, partial [Prevotellaceae bacterium]|nr:hypothetical protein [Prevotellaceae bacterium]